MKTDRLLEIIIYLLNHETATARQLADRFGVSVRTIQRDMDSICLAGVPLIAEVGSSGGYSILPDYRIKNQFVDKSDFALIIMALKSLNTGYESSRLESILDKYLSLKEADSPRVFLDYSVTKENENVRTNNRTLEEAIARSVQVEFNYRNASGGVSHKTVCPLALRFKWYDWYLFALDPSKNDTRTYKVARITGLMSTGIPFESKENVEKLLKASEEEYLRSCADIEVWCTGDSIMTLEEYFPEEKKEPLGDGNFIMHLHVPPGEKLWKALLLSMGDKIKILSPDDYREELIRTAEKFLTNYDRQLS